MILKGQLHTTILYLLLCFQCFTDYWFWLAVYPNSYVNLKNTALTSDGFRESFSGAKYEWLEPGSSDFLHLRFCVYGIILGWTMSHISKICYININYWG